MEIPERVYCAAIWYKKIENKHLASTTNPSNITEGIVVLGHRHGDVIRNVYNLLGLRSVENGENCTGEYVQGFLTNKNRFVDREEGAKIAMEQNQIKDLGRFNPKHLYSEDLY